MLGRLGPVFNIRPQIFLKLSESRAARRDRWRSCTPQSPESGYPENVTRPAAGDRFAAAPVLRRHQGPHPPEIPRVEAERRNIGALPQQLSLHRYPVGASAVPASPNRLETVNHRPRFARSGERGGKVLKNSLPKGG